MSQCEQNRDEKNSQILTKIYEEQGPFIQSVLRFALKNQQDREDVFQEVFITLLHKDNLSEILNIKGFLYRLVLNKANDFQRTKRTQEGKFKEYLENVQEQPAKDQVQEMITLEQTNKTIELIQEYLTPKQAEAIIVRFQSDYDYAKAAGKMKVKKKTIVHNASLGIKKLRTILKKLDRAEKNNEGDHYEL